MYSKNCLGMRGQSWHTVVVHCMCVYIFLGTSRCVIVNEQELFVSTFACFVVLLFCCLLVFACVVSCVLVCVFLSSQSS